VVMGGVARASLGDADSGHPLRQETLLAGVETEADFALVH
jgi:hypothetical protein